MPDGVKRSIRVVINGKEATIETSKENFNVAAYLAKFKRAEYDVGHSVAGGVVALNKMN
jgi:hypothetical protein|tara:strand:- start:942 stop:1118 length:177 start_codon:yes stop_codon:yes gene_type:complete